MIFLTLSTRITNTNKLKNLFQILSIKNRIQYYSSSNKSDQNFLNRESSKEISKLIKDYDLLQINPNSNIEEIYKTYKSLAFFFNPKIYYEDDVNFFNKIEIFISLNLARYSI